MPEDKYCFSWFANRPTADGQERAALLTEAKWTPGQIITVGFLEGDPGLQQRVKEVALRWTGPDMANLTLDFRDNTDTMIRIAFMQGKGSWSTIGTTCQMVPPGRPTMNFGWLTPQSGDLDIQEVVLHEFGHALGLIHEHQNPAGGINWDKEAIYKELAGPPNNWDKETIDRNMFEAYERGETNFTQVDAESIMMYPIPARWTTDGFSVGNNTELSEQDKQFIRQQYP